MTACLRSNIGSLLLLLLTACSVTTSMRNLPPGAGQLELTISGFRNDRGEALIYIYPGPTGFPAQEAPGLIRIHHPIHQGNAQLVMELPYGAYGISVLHDEDLDGQMARSPLGFPREGFGFSRNPDPTFGAPKFSRVRFLFVTPHQSQRISMHYETLRKHRPPGAGPPAG